ncbi:MAG: response regulator [Caldilineaceae bacterium]
MHDSTIHALLVEDNRGDAFLIQQLLADVPAIQVAFTCVERLATALDLLEHRQFEVIFVDLTLPDSNGYATFERLRQKALQSPLIVLTGLDDQELALRAVRAGAQDYLVKGEITSHLLARSIRYAIERKRTEEALRVNQLRYQALFENSNTGIFIISLEHCYLNLNQQAAQLLGGNVSEFIGKKVTEFVVEHGQQSFAQRIAHLLTGKAIPIYECTLVRADGSQVPLEVNETLVRDVAGNPLYLQSIARDISKRKRAETALEQERTQLAQRVEERTQELRTANLQLQQSARLKDEFMATVSHELRTPLSVILALSEGLQEEIYGALLPPQSKALERIQKSGRHLLELINDILDVSKIESGKLELEIGPVSLQGICDDSVQMMQAAAQAKQIQLQKAIPQEVDKFYADGRRLMQILLNLLNNAVKFTPAGGKVGLEVEPDAGGESLRFSVWDTGIGIATSDLPKLFRPFVQLDSRLSRQYQGAGLGLALVYRLTELHGGSVRVESTVNQGSRFTVLLPLMPPPAYLEVTGSATPQDIKTWAKPKPTAKAPLVLLVDDNPLSLEGMQAYLENYGYRVIAATNGVTAVTQTQTHAPDLILMDIQMPQMNGLDAIRKIRQLSMHSHLPIIALTALAMPGDRERCLGAGADAYLSKPLSLRQLLQVMNQYLNAEA